MDIVKPKNNNNEDVAIDSNYIAHDAEVLSSYLANMIKYQDVAQDITVSANGNKYAQYTFDVPDGYYMLTAQVIDNGYVSEFYSTMINYSSNYVVINTHSFISYEATKTITVRAIFARK